MNRILVLGIFAASLGVICMYEGVPVSGLKCFALLNQGDEFCGDLGRVILAAGRLEVAMANLIEREDSTKELARPTLGQLIQHARSNDRLCDMIPHLETLTTQRNYLTHNTFALLSDRIEQTILEREDIIDSDAHTYTERAWVLNNNLNALADIKERRIGECK